MNPSQLLCLTVVLISGVTAQIPTYNYKCLEDLTASWDVSQCPRTDEWIACLQKAIADPTMAPHRSELTSRLQRYQKSKREEVPCPTLEAVGSCVDRETYFCLNEQSNSVKERCAHVPTRLNCLYKIPKSCTTEDLRYQLGVLENDKKSCESGDFRKDIRHDECSQGINSICVKFLDALNGQMKNSPEAREKLAAANRCLDSLRCDDTNYVQYIKQQLSSLYEGN